ncbi:hypothetical protein [uncultured Aquimarina sp.]|uniref:hypothetical protein n=1 Tax=uncultured Aquimarina sp. TaxID=575652 RepID=UPI0026200CB6|nr:hypothetical protein [uncultured Aquimarina sp.]
MKNITAILLTLTLFASCTYEDDSAPLHIEQIFVDNPDETIILDIIYVLPSKSTNKSIYSLNESDFIKNLNGSYFNRYNIGLKLGQVKTMINDELYDLRDNRNSESRVFLQETQEHYNQKRLTAYIIKRANTIAIAGIGKDQRILITDEFLNQSTVPHEIGHALGLFHFEEEGNLMSLIRPYLRKEFTDAQVSRMKERINKINSL